MKSLEEHMEDLADEVRARQSATRKAAAKPRRGEAHGRAKLRGEQVANIRLWRTEGASLKMIAERYGVSVSAISSICLGKRWGHI